MKGMKKYVTLLQSRRAMAAFLAFVMALTPLQAQAIPTKDQDFYSGNDILYYDPDGVCGSTTGSGIPKLDGFELPASKGKTGFEESVNANGIIPSGGRVTFAKHAKLGQEYRDYYITMRWGYVRWNWNGTSTGGAKQPKMYNWLAEKPRLVLVTNTRTKKSIIAVVMEAGPAPWTGVDTYPNNNPKQGWKNPQDGTPAEYKGRVSGFPPKAIKALGAKQGMSNGDGDELLYSWAPDQNAKPGPTKVVQQQVSGSVDASDVGCNNGAGAFVNAEGYAMPIGLAKKDISNGYRWPCPSICHHDGTGAFDLAHKKTVSGSGGKADGLTTGAPIYAIHDGHVLFTRNTYNGISGCGSIQFVEDNKDKANDGWTYWYGHISNKFSIKNGQKVKAGTQMGVVGLRKCTGNNSYPHLHIDRGSPKGHTGGSRDSRDRGFVKLLNSIYASMK